MPKDICQCEVIAKEEQRIKIHVEKRKWGREVTIIEGIDEKDVDLHQLATKLKHKLACGGTAKNGKIELQGDHRERVKSLLIQEGFSEDNIDIT